MTFMAGNAIRGAAQEALQKWQQEERPAVAEYTYYPPRTTPFDPQTGRSEPNYAYGYVAETVDLEVDLETGEIQVVNVVCANDVGRAINPQLVQGQVEGAIVQAHGYAALEEFQMRDGHVITQHLSTYLIPTVLDIPNQVETVILEHADPLGPWGARGMGEMPYLPYLAAVVAALHSATGIWFHEQPLTRERLVKAFREVGLGD
jgi:CO/xanthine dehydrogenase Mo-binding subunit